MDRTLILLTLSSLLASSLSATVYQVTSPHDEGQGSLREAILQANRDSKGPHQIQIAPGVVSIRLDSPLPPITQNLHLYKADFPLAIDAAGIHSVFFIAPEVTECVLENIAVYNPPIRTLSRDPNEESGQQAAITVAGSASLKGISITPCMVGQPSIAAVGRIFADTSTLKGTIYTVGSLIFDQEEDDHFSGVVEGPGLFVKSNRGTLYLDAPQAYRGGTLIHEGVLIKNAPDALPAQGGLMIHAPGVLDLGPYPQRFERTLAGNGTVIIRDSLLLSLPEHQTFHGTLVGKGSLIKEGPGTLTLLGISDYKGGTLLKEGALEGNAKSLRGRINNGGAVIFNQEDDGVFQGMIHGRGSLIKTGAGRLDLSAGNFYLGGTVVRSGVLRSRGHHALPPLGDLTVEASALLELDAYEQLIEGTVKGRGTIDLGTGSLTIASNEDSYFSGSIIGKGALLKQGKGTLLLDGENSYQGGTHVHSGLLIKGNETALPSGGGLQIESPGRVDLGGFDHLIQGGLQGTGILIQDRAALRIETEGRSIFSGEILGEGPVCKLGNGTQVFAWPSRHLGTLSIYEGTVEGNADNLPLVIENQGRLLFNQMDKGTYSGTLSGSGMLIKQGSGELLLAGINRYQGGLRIEEGTLRKASPFSLPEQGDIWIGPAGSLKLGSFGQRIEGSLNGFGKIELEGQSQLLLNSASDGHYAGHIVGQGSFIKRGGATQFFEGAHDYIGETRIEEGTLGLGINQSLPAGSTLTVLSGATLDLNEHTLRLSKGIFGEGRIDLGKGMLVLEQEGVFSFGGELTGSGALHLKGEGTLQLQGNSSYSGGTFIQSGTLEGTTRSLQGKIGNQGVVCFMQEQPGHFIGEISGKGRLVKQGAGELLLTSPQSYKGGTEILAGVLRTDASFIRGPIRNEATLVFEQRADAEFGESIHGSGQFIKAGEGSLKLTGKNAYSGGTEVRSGRLVGSAASICGPLLNQSEVIFDQSGVGTFTSLLSGSGRLVKTGLGMLILTEESSSVKEIDIQSGTLKASAAIFQGSVRNNSHLIFEENGEAVFTGYLEGNGCLTKGGSGKLILKGNQRHTGGTTVTAGTLEISTGSLQGDIANQSHLIFRVEQDSAFKGSISGIGSVEKRGSATLQLDTPQHHSGETLLAEGTIQLAAPNSLPFTSLFRIEKGARLELKEANQTFIGELEGQGEILLGGSTLTIANPGLSLFDGTFRGEGSLHKKGMGTLILTQAPQFKGGAFIDQGTLQGTSVSLPSSIFNQSTLLFAQTEDGSYSGTVTGSGKLIKQGKGALKLTSAHSYSGGTEIREGELRGNAASIQGNILNQGTLVFEQILNGTFYGSIQGSGIWIKEGEGTLALQGRNPFTGSLYLNQGALRKESRAGLPDLGRWNLEQGTAIHLNGWDHELQGALHGKGELLLGGAEFAFRPTEDNLFEGQISGVGRVIKKGPHSFTLTGTNSFTGPTWIQEGMVKKGGRYALPDLSSCILGSLGILDLNGWDQTLSSLEGGGRVLLGGAQLSLDSDQGGYFEGTLEGNGTLIKRGAGTQWLLGSTAHQGETALIGGSLVVSSKSLQGPLLNRAMLIWSQEESGCYPGSIRGTGQMIKQGKGALTLTGANTYNGATTVAQGVLRKGSKEALPSHSFYQIEKGATLDLDGMDQRFDQGLSGAGELLLGRAQATVDVAETCRFDGSICGEGSIRKEGPGTLTLLGSCHHTGGTWIEEGRLEGSASSLQGTIYSQGTLVFQQDQPATFYGSVQGSGMLFKRGHAPLRLAGEWHLDGPLSIEEGDLIASARYLSKKIHCDTALVFDQQETEALEGSLSGKGALVKQGPAALKLRTSQSYSGGTQLKEGTLLCEAPRVLPAQGDLQLQSEATLDLGGFDQTVQGVLEGTGLLKLGRGQLTLISERDSRFSGRVEGEGALVKKGPGMLTLLGKNQHTGGTAIEEGILKGSSHTLSARIHNSATLLFDQTTNGTYAGAINGEGLVIKEGTGRLNLTGPFAQQMLLIREGALAINGRVESTVCVESGGELNGSGTLVGHLIALGVVSPGNSIGNLTILGDYTQYSGSTFLVEVDPIQSDHLQISGRALIETGAQLKIQLDAPSHDYQNQLYSILTAEQGISGRYSSIETSSIFVRPSLAYSDTNIDLLLTFASLHDLIPSGNTGSVAGCVDSASLATGSELLIVRDYLLGLNSVDQIQTNLDQLQPSALKDLVLSQQETLLLTQSLLRQRWTSLWLEPTCPPERSWNVWATGAYQFAKQKSAHAHPGYTATSGLALIGGDYQWDHSYFFGTAFGYNGTHLSLHDQRGAGKGDNYQGIVYGGWNGELWFADLSLLGGYADLDSHRSIRTDVVQATAKGSHGMGELETSLTTGLRWVRGRWGVSPYVSLDYLFLHEIGFDEKGGGDLALGIRASDSQMIRFSAGLLTNVHYTSDQGEGALQLGLSYLREERYSGSGYHAHFKDQSCSFHSDGLWPDRNLWMPTFKLSYCIPRVKLSMTLGYQGVYGSGYQQQAFSLELIY